MPGCDDCATCQRRPELARSLGRDQAEVHRLAERCPRCGHRLHRHLHGALNLHRDALEAHGIELAVDPPPRDSPLGRLLVELGEYDDYPGNLGH